MSQDRVQMSLAALRAWKTAPWLGVGPGMHQNLWLRFAASPDGDRKTFRWPSMLNNNYHSYEAHNDWVQFLEEYGTIGVLLFLFASAAAFAVLQGSLRRERRGLEREGWELTGHETHAYVLAALLACVAMAFHSIGDFNLQMPATVWLLAAIVAIGGKHTRPERRVISDQ